MYFVSVTSRFSLRLGYSHIRSFLKIRTVSFSRGTCQFSTSFDRPSVENCASRSFLVSTRGMASQSSDGEKQGSSIHRNRLADEKSPYLLQHAGNPVNWYPWGKEAFQKAKAEDKPIFLSVGYSTCHWCHVMERESFESEEIGKILNDHFVAIKVDREERPDVDRVYMTFVQATSGGGGWPMSVWLTPDLKPMVGGTYFPPDDRYFGRPGFKSILLNIAKQWKAKREILDHQGTAILDALMQGTSASEAPGQTVPNEEAVTKCYEMLEKSYDKDLGGFGNAPKFPQPVNFNFLFWVAANNPNTTEGKNALDMCVTTLKFMAKGGIHDHISQGFHRYSTDKMWHVPHFEKMLYDQGQLLVAYSAAYQLTKNSIFEIVARDIVEYVCRDLRSPAGGFYSAEDADSYPTEGATEKKEGAFCVWTYDEIYQLITENVDGNPDLKMADIFCYHYDIKKNGNVDPMQDPHDELKNQNVLIVKGSDTETAQHFLLTKSQISDVLDKCKKVLYTARQGRPKPHLDDKMLTSWNGLMISGLAKAGQALGDPAIIQTAVDAATFLRTNMYDVDKNILLRSCYTATDKSVSQIATPIEGFADDYAYLIRGLLDLYEATFDEQYIEWAEKLQDQQNTLFWDEDGGAYFNSKDDPTIVLRLKEDQDGAEPSPNSVSANNLIRLSNFLQRDDLYQMCVRVVKVFHERLTKIPIALPEMMTALMMIQRPPKQIVLVGDKGDQDLKDLINCVNSHFLPNKVLIVVNPQSDTYLCNKLEFLKTLTKVDGKATAYVCENYACSLPVNSVDELDKLLTS